MEVKSLLLWLTRPGDIQKRNLSRDIFNLMQLCVGEGWGCDADIPYMRRKVEQNLWHWRILLLLSHLGVTSNNVSIHAWTGWTARWSRRLFLSGSVLWKCWGNWLLVARYRITPNHSSESFIFIVFLFLFLFIFYHSFYGKVQSVFSAIHETLHQSAILQLDVKTVWASSLLWSSDTRARLFCWLSGSQTGSKIKSAFVQSVHRWTRSGKYPSGYI